MSTKILALKGDGIGPEIVDQALAILEVANQKHALGIEVSFDEVGFTSLEKYGTTLRPEVLERARSYQGLILGTQSHADYPAPELGGVNISARFRVDLDLYANIRPARTRDYIEANLKPGKSMDLVIVREATEGFYADRNMARGWGEMMPTPDLALAVRKVTRHASERIAREAFEIASTRRKKVTVVHKANSFHMTDGLFLEATRKIAEQYPGVALEELLIDAATAHLVRTPERFDVILGENFYCDILSDLASELSGSLGLAGSTMANDVQCCAQAQHGSAPDIAGKNIANPTSMILSVTMLLRWLANKNARPEFEIAANEIDAALETCLASPDSRTFDLGGKLTCSEFGSAVAALLVSPKA